MFKSKYYLPVDAIAKSYQNKSKLNTFTYDNDFDVYENAIILPLRNCSDLSRPGLAVYEGGVCDKNYNFISGYSRSNDKCRIPAMEVVRSYKEPISINLDETVIYGGIIFNHFGHFLVDSFARLWYAAKYKEEKYKVVFLKTGKFDLQNYHLKLFELLGIDKTRILIAENPIMFTKVIVPKQAWFSADSSYNHELFRMPWDLIRSNVTSKKDPKIYLSRAKYKNQDIFGEEYFEQFFESQGFKIIYPEQLPVEEQIAYISGADEVACTFGTLSHHAAFANDGTKFIHLLRFSLSAGSGFQEFLHAVKGIDFVYVDVALSIFPNYHASYAGYLIGPTSFWGDFLKKEYEILGAVDVYEYLDQINIKLGSYIKLYTGKMTNERNFSLTYGYRFNYVNYLKQLYHSYAPWSYPRLQRSMRISANPFFKEKIFLYKIKKLNIRSTVKLLADGRIWPISHNELDNEKYWSFLKNRLYFLDADYQPIVEFVAEITGKKYDDEVKYEGAKLEKISDTCSLQTVKPGRMRNWIIKHTIKYLVNGKRYKKLKRKPDRFFRDSKNPFIRFLGRYYIRGTSTVIFFWRKQFREYFDTHDMAQKVANLKDGMDEDSVSYIDNFMKLSKYWYKSTHVGSQRPVHEQLKHKAYREFRKTFEQPFPDILRINPYYFFDNYGLADLPEEVLTSIDGKVIIDGGGLNGDTALTFHHHFPNSEIHVYEPVEHYVNIINRSLEEDNCNYKIKPVNKGLGDKIDRQFMRFGAGANMADITTIDTEYHDASAKIGLIKLDVEGMETQMIKGAEAVIARDRPVLAIAIYHRPEDFFELKDRIKALNPAYRFMIRKSEPSLPQADLVLIAY